MVNQQFFLPMIPDSAPIVINVAQNDYDASGYLGRLIFNLVSNGTDYDMDGATAVFQGLKPDGTSFAYDANIVSASVVRVPLKMQMTAVRGRVVCELVLTNSDGRIGSFNIWLEVQESALSGAGASETDIPSLVSLAEQAADRAEQAANNAEAWSEHPPYIGINGHWFVYDTLTDTYVDSGVDARGTNGNKWYTGTAVSGKSSTPTAFPTGIALAYVGDLYLNITEGAIYHNTVEGDATQALWVYDMTLSGGGGGATVLTDLTDVNITSPANGQVLMWDQTTSKWINTTISTGSTVVWTQLQSSTGATKIAVITIDGVDYDVYAPTGGGGGGASSLSQLSDVNLSTPTDGQVLIFDGATSKWVNMTYTGGHTMLPDPTQNPDEDDVVNVVSGATDTNDNVPSLYGLKVWSNCDAIMLLVTVTQDTDTIGDWQDNWKDAGASRSGWLWHEALHGIISNNNIEFKEVFDISNEQVISIRGFHLDDDIQHNGVDGGAIAIKLNTPISTPTAILGIKLVKQRTKVGNFTVLT